MSKIALATTQRILPFSTLTSGSVGLTFRDSKAQPIHRWYPYVEGFSAEYVRKKIGEYGNSPNSIYDPFGGAGTTPLAASMLGIPSYFSEINPFMSFVAETKINATRWAQQNLGSLEELSQQYICALNSKDFFARRDIACLDSYYNAFPERNFFEDLYLRELIAARELAIEICKDCDPVKQLFLLTIAANVVNCSHMTRRADLRRRRSDEYKTRVVKTVEFITAKVSDIVHDIKIINSPLAKTTKVSPDARSIPHSFEEAFTLAITSPPYLNGTNYFRNTKLELWFLGFIQSEEDLKSYYRQAVAGGINNVSKDNGISHRFGAVEEVARVLDHHALDSRIPKLVRTYFSDMLDVFFAVWKALEDKGQFIVDIGDSKFYGVHVPTDKLLIEVAKEAGFVIESNQPLAKRYSRDKSPLQQVEITFRKVIKPQRSKKRDTSVVPAISKTLRDAIEYFRKELPYKKEPYSSKAWGHSLHSLCSYQGKLKPALAHWLVKLFSQPDMTVLDPLGGVGTVGLEACLQGRKAISNDLSPLPAVITQAKLSPPKMEDALSALHEIEHDIPHVKLNETDIAAAEFGLNAKVKDYFHPETLVEILKARKWYLGRDKLTDAQAFIKACLLHILHGNRPYALSRQSHSLTPYNPRGEFEYKSVIQKLDERVRRILAEPPQSSFVRGESFNQNFCNLREHIIKPVDRIITSPPFIGMRFDRPNWMRLWFCGWQAKDFHATHENFLERQQMKSLDVYADFFDLCADLLTENGVLVMHIGGSNKYNMLDKLIELSSKRYHFVSSVSECVADIEKHGIRDKGTTSTHHFLFLTRAK